jgi:hypothetical protein
MKTTSDNIINVLYNKYRIVIDKLIEYDYNGDMALTKKICTVIEYDGDVASYKLFNVSPYTGLMDMDIMAKIWIDCGCPNDNGHKWTKDSLHAWVAG